MIKLDKVWSPSHSSSELRASVQGAMLVVYSASSGVQHSKVLASVNTHVGSRGA